jgi:hypothetical protein
MNATVILNEIEALRNQSFKGWTPDEIKGYLTALKTLEEKIKSHEARRQA